jgi:acid phosphatase family membrane protein YuiD
MSTVFTSKIFLVPATAVILASVLKMTIIALVHREFSWQTILSYGGMPSAHAAIVSSLTATILFEQGPSALFFVTFFMSLITIRDAFGVRWQSGQQAKLLNKINAVFDIEEDMSLKEILGHTKTQTFFGIVLGILVAVIGYTAF